MVSLSMKFYNVLNTANKYIYINTTGYIYKLLSYTGLESADYETQLYVRAASDGGYLQSSTIPPRRISVTFTVGSPANNETARAEVLQYFMLRNKCYLTVYRGSTERTIPFYVETGPEVINPSPTNSKISFVVRLVCPEPFFEDPAETLNFASGFVTIANTNRIPVPFYVTITATGGSVVNPKISFGSGGSRFVKVATTLTNTQVMVINTWPDTPSVKINGAYNYDYRLDSDFFNLDGYGNKTIYLTADSGSGYAVATCKYQIRHLGV